MALDTWGLYTINSRVLVGQRHFFTYLYQNEEINEMFGSLSRAGRGIQGPVGGQEGGGAS